jgi:hypothetical protein
MTSDRKQHEKSRLLKDTTNLITCYPKAKPTSTTIYQSHNAFLFWRMLHDYINPFTMGLRRSRGAIEFLISNFFRNCVHFLGLSSLWVLKITQNSRNNNIQRISSQGWLSQPHSPFHFLDPGSLALFIPLAMLRVSFFLT